MIVLSDMEKGRSIEIIEDRRFDSRDLPDNRKGHERVTISIVEGKPSSGFLWPEYFVTPFRGSQLTVFE